MRKLPYEIDIPFDNINLDLIDNTVDFFNDLGFSPNGITTLSLISGLYSIHKFIKQEYYLSAFGYIVSYYFDCMDGHMARKFKMVSEFGDYYDHIKDLLVGALLLYYIGNFYYNMKSNYKYVILFIVIITIYISSVQMGCQEIYSGTSTNTTSIYMHLCSATTKEEAYNVMKYTRHGGTGTLTLVIAGIICFAEIVKKHDL